MGAQAHVNWASNQSHICASLLTREACPKHFGPKMKFSEGAISGKTRMLGSIVSRLAAPTAGAKPTNWILN